MAEVQAYMKKNNLEEPAIYTHREQMGPQAQPGFPMMQPTRPKFRAVGAGTKQFEGDVGYSHATAAKQIATQAFRQGGRKWMNYVRDRWSASFNVNGKTVNKFTRPDLAKLSGSEGEGLAGFTPVDSRLIDDPTGRAISRAVENGDFSGLIGPSASDSAAVAEFLREHDTKALKEGEGRSYYLLPDQAVQEIMGQTHFDNSATANFFRQLQRAPGQDDPLDLARVDGGAASR